MSKNKENYNYGAVADVNITEIANAELGIKEEHMISSSNLNADDSDDEITIEEEEDCCYDKKTIGGGKAAQHHLHVEQRDDDDLTIDGSHFAFENCAKRETAAAAVE